MCDKHRGDIIGTGLPVATFENAVRCWVDFIDDPSSWATFDKADFSLRLLFCKWEQYAQSRRCAAGAKWRPMPAQQVQP